MFIDPLKIESFKVYTDPLNIKSRSSITSMAAVTGGIVDQESTASKKIDFYPSCNYHLLSVL